jgi:hypothetical protein
MEKIKEIKIKLDQFNKEIIETIRDKPDKITGKRNFSPIMSEFILDRDSSTLTSFMDISSHISVDAYELISKKDVVARTISACWSIQDQLEKHIDRLEKLFEKLEDCENGKN